MDNKEQIIEKQQQINRLQEEIKQIYMKNSSLNLNEWYKDKEGDEFFKPRLIEEDGTVWGTAIRLDSSDGVFVDSNEYYGEKVIRALELTPITYEEIVEDVNKFIQHMLVRIK